MKKLKVKDVFNIKGRGTLYSVSRKESGVLSVGDEVEIDGKTGVITVVEMIYKAMYPPFIADEYCISIREQVCNSDG